MSKTKTTRQQVEEMVGKGSKKFEIVTQVDAVDVFKIAIDEGAVTITVISPSYVDILKGGMYISGSELYDLIAALIDAAKVARQ